MTHNVNVQEHVTVGILQEINSPRGTVITFMGINSENSNHELDKVYSSPVLRKLINSMTNAKIQSNNLTAFKKFLESGDNGLDELISTIDYSYAVDFSVFFKDEKGKIIESDAMKLLQESIGMSGNMGSMYQGAMGMSEFPVYTELLSGNDGALINDLIYEQYDITRRQTVIN